MHQHIYNAPTQSDATRKASIMEGLESGYVINYYERNHKGHMAHKLRLGSKSHWKAIKLAYQMVRQ